MRINLVDKTQKGSAIVLPIFSGANPDLAKYNFPKADGDYVRKIVGIFDAAGNDAKSAILPASGAAIILLGLGDKKKWNVGKFAVAFRRAIVCAKGDKIKNICLHLDDFSSPVELGDAVKIAAANLSIADFSFNKYKEKPKGGWPKIDSVSIVADSLAGLKKYLAEGTILGEEVNACRNLSNTPGGDMTPQVLAASALAEARKNKISIKVLDEKEMKKLGMGGVLGVSRGSSEKPKFIIMEYNGGGKGQSPLVFVGKGVTFDSGGLNLKPSEHIYEMHMDMSGGAAVIHAISAIARAKLKVNVIGLVPAVENMPSGSSYRPGDLLKTITGKTIEVLNTDAEGRVILADALGYAQKYKPELIVDVATLTGAAMVALGTRAVALFSTDEKLEKMAREVGDKNAEPVWPLPLWDDYAADIKGTFGDVANTGKNHYGGAINGAIFLKQFVGDYPWIHLDIAPTMTTIEGQYLAKGASGAGVRLLYEIAKKYEK